MFKILQYNDLDTTGAGPQFKRVVQYLQAGDFQAAEVKKMAGTDGLYRAKLDRADRLLFKFARYKGQSYLLLLEVIKEHDYEGSKFLRGAQVLEEKWEVTYDSASGEKQTQLVYVNPQKPQFHLLDKIISFDDDQREVYGLPVPLVLIGSAGSGKTALTLEKIKDFHGQVAYVSLSPYLVENARRMYFSYGYENPKQEVDFISFEEYLQSIRIPKGREITFRDFDGWYSRYRQTYKIKDVNKLLEEFKGVITGSVVDRPFLTRKDYQGLGIKQSIFLEEEREKVYDIFERYLEFLREGNFYDSNMVAYEYLPLIQPRYDFVVVDEVQDITNVQLMLILKSLVSPANFLLSGDSNQIVHPNFFSWANVKSLFFKEEVTGSLIRILKTNYRNSQQITKLSNDLLKIKNARFGSIDKESTYLIDTVSDDPGEINFFPDQEKVVKDLNLKTRSSAKYAILVMDKEAKMHAKKNFDSPLVFTIQEAKGLEYENIILHNFISSNEEAFREIARGVEESDLQDENMRYSRVKEKSNKDLEAYKFYINSLYVAFTRAVKNVYIIESNSKNDLLRLLGLVEVTQKISLPKTETSTDEEWLEEARRLEKQGKLEQSQEIRDRIRGIAYLSPEQVENLVNEIFKNPGSPDSAKCQALFTYAKNRFRLDLIQRLYEKANYGPAKQFMLEYKSIQSSYTKHIRNGNLAQVKRAIQKYGINMRDTDGKTGLMIAVLYNKVPLIDFFIQQEAELHLSDKENRTVLHMAFLAFDNEDIDEKRFAQLYLKFSLPYLKVKVDDRIIKISAHTMEYFMMHFMIALRSEIIANIKLEHLKGITMEDFFNLISWMPNQVLAPYRRQRQYINSILAKNEVDRQDKYNKQLFRRKYRGCYDLYENLEVILEMT